MTNESAEKLPRALERRPQARRGADIIVDCLIEAGVDIVFGIPGGAISPLNDALLDRPEIRVMVTRHEAEAAFAAAGYAQSSGRLGVVFATSGPGALNALTGLASAFCDHLPMLLLIGEVPRATQGRGALQDGSSHHLNVMGMARQVSKDAWEAHDAAALPSLIRRAIRVALKGPTGPVVVALPVCVQTAPTVASNIDFARDTADPVADKTLQHVYDTLSRAKRPLVFAGSGLRQGHGAKLLVAFAEHYQTPVVTSPKGKGVFPEDHALALGVYGIGGHPSATAYVEERVDVLLAVGTSLGDLATEGFNPALYPTHSLIHVDLDGAAIGRAYPADIGVVSSAAAFLSGMIRLQPPGSVAPPGLGVRRHSSPHTVLNGEDGLIRPDRALWELQELLPRDTIFAIDSGEHFLLAAHYLVSRAPDSFLAMTGLGSMGASIGAAIGAQLAHPARRVVAILGDGGFSMSATGISDAVLAKLPIIFCIMNDRRLTMCELGHSNVYGRQPNYPMPEIDVVMLAESLGARGIRISHANELATRTSEILRSDIPVVIDIRIDREFALPKRDRIRAMSTPSPTRAG